MARRKKSTQQRSLPEWHRRATQLIRMADQGRPLRLEAEQFDIPGRDRSWNLFAQSFLSANQPSFTALDVTASLVPDTDRISLQLRPGGTVGAVPLRSPTTRKIIGGVVVRPRFGWNDIGPLLHQIGWTASPRLLDLPLVPGAAKEVPPWVLAGPILQRLRALLDELTRGFRWCEEVRESPRGQILWGQYARNLGRGMFHRLPCRFPELGPDQVLRGMLRWGIQTVHRSLAGWADVDPIARRLTELALELLQQLSDAKPIVPARGDMDRLLMSTGLPPVALQRGLQALGWIVDERGLAGTAQTDGLSWCLPMYEVFERWVEHLARLWAHGFGGRVRSGRNHETLVPIRWEHRGTRSLSSLVPDLVVEQGQRVWIIDAKYKAHFEELDDHGWAELAEELQSEHRHDVHQALAYASTRDAPQITTLLAYPMRLPTWQRLAERGRTIITATIAAGSREVRIALAGVPIQTPHTGFSHALIQAWEVLKYQEAA